MRLFNFERIKLTIPIGISITALILFYACKTLMIPPIQERIISKEIEPFVVKFEQEFQIEVNYPIVFARLETDKVGVCTFWKGGSKFIQIDSNFFRSASAESREQVIYHELGHCSLNLDHDDSLINFIELDAIMPISIMYPFAFNHYQIDVYIVKRQHYIDQLRKAYKTNIDPLFTDFQ